MKRNVLDPQNAQRIVEMDAVTSMECFSFPDNTTRRVIDGASLVVQSAETWGITGTEPFEMELLMEIMGNVKPYESGRCSLSQLGMMRLKRRVLDHMFYINDQKLMYPHMHVLSWLMFASRHTGGSPAVRQVEWLELLLELDLYYLTETYARFLTAAEQAIVASLLALKMPRIRLLLMDLSHIEVPALLYPAFFGIVSRLHDQGKSVVIASIQRDLIQMCASHAAFLLKGKIDHHGTVAALCKQYDTRRLVVHTIVPESAALALSGTFPDMRTCIQPRSVWLCGTATPKTSEACVALEHANMPFDCIEIPQPNLELAFREVAM
jgi:ABC-2 type transport system ATP-binding protein